MATPPIDPLAAYAQGMPDKAAVVVGDEVTSYSAFNGEINRLANGLGDLGIEPGERGVWCGPNSKEVLTAIHAARKIGLTAVPLAYRFTPEEMQYVVDNSDATVVIIDAEQADRIA